MFKLSQKYIDFCRDMNSNADFLEGTTASGKTTIGAGVKWLYGELKEEKKHYEELYQQKEAEVESLKDKINQLKIKIIKLETENETRH